MTRGSLVKKLYYVSAVAGSFTGTFIGNITGNVTGNVTGDEYLGIESLFKIKSKTFEVDTLDNATLDTSANLLIPAGSRVKAVSVKVGDTLGKDAIVEIKGGLDLSLNGGVAVTGAKNEGFVEVLDNSGNASALTTGSSPSWVRIRSSDGAAFTAEKPITVSVVWEQHAQIPDYE